MRLKHIMEYVQLPSKARLLWLRITFSRVTTIYFVFSVVHCIVQVIIQVQAYSTNAQAASFLSNLIHQGNAFTPGFAVIGEDLRWCSDIPSSLSAESCQVIWRSSARDEDDSDSDDGESVDSTGSLDSVEETQSADPIVLPTTTTSVAPILTDPIRQPTSTLQVSSTAPILTTSVPAISSSIPTITPTLTSTSSTLPPQVTPNPIAAPVITNSPVLIIDDESVSDSVSDGVSGNSGDSLGGQSESDIPGDAFAIPLRVRRRREIRINAVDVGGSTEVTIDGFGWNNERRTLNQTCLVSLNWPLEKLEFTRREDIVFIMFQLWVLGMSVVAILNESMPHIIASLLTHVLATAWGGFQLHHTASFHADFNRLTTFGACQINLLPSYWKERGAAEISSLVLNAVALLLSAFLSWRLVKLFGWQTFKRVGASRTIDRIYKLVLSLSIAIQLSTFFIVVSIALWIDQLYNGPIGQLAKAAKLYKAILITVLILLPPWLYLGWIGVRRELKLLTAIFLVMAMGYLAGWGAMFTSITFKWTYTLWRFFSIITTSSVLLTSITLLLGIVCRYNFGKGLPRYLNHQEPLPGDDFKPAYPPGQPDLESEKIDFPSFDRIPTYSAMFDQGFNVPAAPSTTKNNPQLGPRFRNTTSEPFETESSMGHSRSDSSGYTWEVASSFSTTHRGTAHARQASQYSNGTYESARSRDSVPPYSGRHTPSEPHPFHDHQKRWVIE